MLAFQTTVFVVLFELLYNCLCYNSKPTDIFCIRESLLVLYLYPHSTSFHLNLHFSSKPDATCKMHVISFPCLPTILIRRASLSCVLQHISQNETGSPMVHVYGASIAEQTLWIDLNRKKMHPRHSII